MRRLLIAVLAVVVGLQTLDAWYDAEAPAAAQPTGSVSRDSSFTISLNGSFQYSAYPDVLPLWYQLNITGHGQPTRFGHLVVQVTHHAGWKIGHHPGLLGDPSSVHKGYKAFTDCAFPWHYAKSISRTATSIAWDLGSVTFPPGTHAGDAETCGMSFVLTPTFRLTKSTALMHRFTIRVYGVAASSLALHRRSLLASLRWDGTWLPGPS